MNMPAEALDAPIGADHLIDQVLAVIRDNVEEDCVIEADSDLRDTPGIDSLSVIMIVDGIEDRFNILVREADIETMTTASSIAALLRDQYGVNES